MKVVKGKRKKCACLAILLGTLVIATPHVLKRYFLDVSLRSTLLDLLYARAGAWGTEMHKVITQSLT